MKQNKKTVKKTAAKPVVKGTKKPVPAKKIAPAKKAVSAKKTAPAKKTPAKPAKKILLKPAPKKTPMKKTSPKPVAKKAAEPKRKPQAPAAKKAVKKEAPKPQPKPKQKVGKNTPAPAKPKVPLQFKSMPMPTYTKDEEPLAPAIVKTVKPAELSAAELAQIKATLTAMRDEVLKRIAEKKSYDMPDAEVGDPIDVATQALDKELLFEITDNDHVTVDQIEAALRRIKLGSYGICEGCRCVIPKKRLHALPFARYCINCQHSNENSPLPES